MSLPRLDFSTLSYNAAKWSLPGKVLLGCALAGLVLVLGEVSHGGPQRERLHGLEAREQALQQQLTEKTDLAASLELRTRQVRSMEDNLASLLGQLPGESELPAVLEDIARLASAHGVWVEGITVLDEAPRQLYIEQPMQISASGVYHDLATFVSALGGLPRVVTVQDVALGHQGALLRLNMLAKTYRSTLQNGKARQVLDPGPQFVYEPSSLRDPFTPPALQAPHVPGRPLPRISPGHGDCWRVCASISSKWSARCPVVRRPLPCCGLGPGCIGWRWVITWGRTMARSRPFKTLLSSWWSCFPMDRAPGSNAREPLC